MATENTGFTMPNDDELAALVAEVTENINGIMKKEADKLAKSDSLSASEGSAGSFSKGSMSANEESSSSSSSFEKGSPSPEGSASPESVSASAGSPEGSASPGGLPEGSEGSPGSASASGEEGAPPMGEEGAPGMDSAGEGAPSVEQLTQLFSQLPDDQLESYYVAIQQAIAQRSGGGEQPGAEVPPSAGAPGPSAAPAGPPGADMGAPPGAGMPPGGPEMGGMPPGGAPGMEEQPPMAMSEKFGELEGQVAELRKSNELLADVLDKLTNTPMRKSVVRYENGIAYIPYQGAVVAAGGQPMKKSLREMTKAEITAKLNEVAKDQKLSKADRQLINAYFDRAVTIDSLEKFFQ